MKKFLLAFALLAVFILPTQAQQPKYVFYFIGDGMGVNQVQGTEMYLSELKGEIGVTPLLFTQFPYSTMATTFSATNGVTDSAAAGTALATGSKTRNGAIAVNTDNEVLETLSEYAKSKGILLFPFTMFSIAYVFP